MPSSGRGHLSAEEKKARDQVRKDRQDNERRDYSRGYDEGAAAFKEAKALTDCPYDFGKWPGLAGWHAGWKAARNYAERAEAEALAKALRAPQSGPQEDPSE